MKKWLLSISLIGAGLLLMLCQSKQKASTNNTVTAAPENNTVPSTPENKADGGGKAVIHGTQDQEKLDSIKRVKNAQKRP
jgi:hypothetical protein